ncbi:MAG: S-layer homology domain-containing protein [Thermoanaerobaculia bacterium]
MKERASTLTLGTALAVLLALPALAQSTGTADDRIRITDPGLLETLGYAPGTPNIYATPEAYAQMLMSPAELAAASELESQDGALIEDESRSPFGDNPGVTTVHATDFVPTATNSSTDYQVGGTEGIGGVELWCNEGNTTFVGVLDGLPHGARAGVRRFWYYDDDAVQDLTVWLQRSCLPFGSAGEPETTILRMNTSSGTPGYGRFGPGTAIGEDIDSRSCVYAVRVRLGNGGACAAGGDLRFSKATLSWQRQVSPAPATATFDDVPTNHLFFRHIEALAGSAITAGCDADSFCPDAPLTRGQMAVFLAIALGLNWDTDFWEPGM